MTTPYTYLIGWTTLGKYYYGVRFAKGCSPSDLWKTYFTSSKQVKLVRKEYGEPDLIQVRRTFETPNTAKDWEHKVLRRMKATKRKDFLNLTDNRCNPSNAGIIRSAEFKQKVSAIQTGKKLTDEHKKKIAKAVSGKRPPEFGLAVSAGMKGMKQSAETIEKRRAKQIGFKQSPEFCEKIRQRLNIQVRSPDGVVYESLLAASQHTGLNIKRLSKLPGSGWVRMKKSR